MLLIESNSYLLGAKNIISESRKEGKMKLRGVFQRANEANANRRIYRRPILEREVQKLIPIIGENRLLGELDHPESEVVKLSNASHMITGLSWDKDDVIGECVLLNTPAGLTAQTLIRDGVMIGISSRGTGSLTPIGESVQEVNDDYNMATFDLVADPSTRGAFPGLTEGNIISEGRKIFENAHSKALKERRLIVYFKDVVSGTFKSKEQIVNEGLASAGVKASKVAKAAKDTFDKVGDEADSAIISGAEKTADKIKDAGKKTKSGAGKVYRAAKNTAKTATKVAGYKLRHELEKSMQDTAGYKGPTTGFKESLERFADSVLFEGWSTGENPIATGERVGAALAKARGREKRKSMRNKARRIADRIHWKSERSAKGHDTNPDNYSGRSHRERVRNMDRAGDKAYRNKVRNARVDKDAYKSSVKTGYDYTKNEGSLSSNRLSRIANSLRKSRFKNVGGIPNRTEQEKDIDSKRILKGKQRKERVNNKRYKAFMEEGITTGWDPGKTGERVRIALKGKKDPRTKRIGGKIIKKVIKKAQKKGADKWIASDVGRQAVDAFKSKLAESYERIFSTIEGAIRK